jgi:hypothetical protein
VLQLSLSATEDKRFLDNWRRKIGAENADRIVNESAKRGTEMHRVLGILLSRSKILQCN